MAGTTEWLAGNNFQLLLNPSKIKLAFCSHASKSHVFCVSAHLSTFSTPSIGGVVAVNSPSSKHIFTLEKLQSSIREVSLLPFE
jgi:hypothetical protein